MSGHMKIAIYPGSFNPWHEGHQDILRKALKIFDQVIVCQMINPDKTDNGQYLMLDGAAIDRPVYVVTYKGLLVDAVKEFKAHAVIRGLRNGYDLQYEQNQQYWNEDLGLEIPVVYFITDRKLGHISSSAIRTIEAFKRYELQTR